ncbi:MAG: PD-(D/E)XK nuclease family protein [Planctomycetes bacterium]|nr:PD-(D/E)XK nuclease family protein [Planctomycetota bacterium]
MYNNYESKTQIDYFKILDRFLVDNSELEELSARLSTFNILGVLRVEQAEIRHSNILAWLLDPQGSHGMGQAFLRRVMSTILLENENIDIELTPAHVELMNMIDIEVMREWKNIDLIAFSPSNKWVLLVENKIKAGATKRQLLKYIEIVKKEFLDFTIIPVLLTLEADEAFEVAEDTGYISWSHAQLYPVANYVINQRKDRIPQDAKVFLEHYLVILRRLTMQDEQIINLCKEIYRKHKDAIDLIVEWGANSQFEAAAESFINDNPDLIPLYFGPRRLWCIPKKWEIILSPCSNRWKHLPKPYPIVCWFSFRQKVSKIGFVIEIGSMENSDERLRLVEAFIKEDFKVSKKALRPEAIYTRVHSVYRSFSDPDDQDDLRKCIDETWKKSQPQLESTTRIIENFDWEK